MKNKLTYFVSRFSMFGIGFFILFKLSGKDAWISVLLGTLLGIIILYIYKGIKDFFRGKDIRETLKKTNLGKFYLLILLIFYIFLASVILILLPLFVNSFYLLYTPKILVILPFLLLAVYISLKEKRTLETLSNLLCPIIIIIIVVYSLLLTKYVDFNNLTPVLSTKTFNVIESALIYAIISSVPQIITINYSNNSFKDDLKDYLLASFVSFGMLFFDIICLGEPLIKIYSFPEYAVLKQIKILDFIENIENIATFIWYFDLFITLSILVTSIKCTLPKKFRPISYTAVLGLLIFLSICIIGSNYRYIITLIYCYPAILFVFFLIFVTFLIYLKKSKKLRN